MLQPQPKEKSCWAEWLAPQNLEASDDGSGVSVAVLQRWRIEIRVLHQTLPCSISQMDLGVLKETKRTKWTDRHQVQ